MSRLAGLVVAAYFGLLVFVAATRGAVVEGLIHERHGDGHLRVIGVGQIRFDGAGAERWAARFRRQHRVVLALRRQLAQRARVRFTLSTRQAIQLVFGHYANQALRVAWCESRMRTDARNGQFAGVFQLGARERALYGDGSSAISQAAAAYAYFVASGRDWSPWQCRP